MNRPIISNYSEFFKNYTYCYDYICLKKTEEEFNLVGKRINILFVILLLMLLSACGKSVTTEDGMKLVKKDKFTFAASGEFKPFSYVGDDGQMKGFDIEVGEALAKELGLEPVQERFKFSGIVEGVKSGRFDAAVASHTITEERLKEVHFSTPYYYSIPQVFTRPDSSVESLDQLKGKEIAVSKGSTYVVNAEEVTDNIQQYDSDVVALEALSQGKHDAVITDAVTGKEAMKSGMNIEGKEQIERAEQAVAVAKDNDILLEKINEALKTLRENGTLKEISEKYFGADITVDPNQE